MANEDSSNSEIKDAIIQVNKEAAKSAPESNWTGVLGKSETIAAHNKVYLAIFKQHKLISAAASLLLVMLISIPLLNSLTSSENKSVKTTRPNKTETTIPESTSTTLTEETSTTTSTTAPATSTTQQSQANKTTSPTTTAPASSRPANPSNLQFTGYDLVGPPGDPATYNTYFSWTASPTPGVKYCVGTTSVGSSQIFPNCTWNYQYLETGTSAGFGLVWAKNTTYKFQVTAINSNNQKSDTIYLDWQLP